MKGPIVVVDYGMGNIHSMIKALRRYDDDVIFTADPEIISKARGLVLPGDGAFAEAMNHLSADRSPGNILLEKVAANTPLLGVCIGFQVLFTDSTETDGSSSSDGDGIIKGLGLIPGHVRRFETSRDYRIPHMGWNNLISQRKESYMNDYMYFIHSYRVEDVSPEYVLARCEYGNDLFPAVVQKGNILATQFHPEKSDLHGLQLIEDWVLSLE